ncbi:MAG: hypothetical protein HQM08_20190 [Candidatus Riflebacteria bacterium]|nr:hypothetical protein [Candidatus Riflebacteria bacterium]
MDRRVIKIESLKEHQDDPFVPGTVEERLALVWPLTLELVSIGGKLNVERRLQRDVVRIGRRKS